MIDCPNGDIRDVLPEYLNDRVSATRHTEVEAHLAGCEACRAELALLRGLRASMRQAPAVNVEAIAAAIPPYRTPARRSAWTGWRAAAAIAAIAVGGTSIALLRDGGDERPQSSPQTVASAPFASPRDSAGASGVTTTTRGERRDSARSTEAPDVAASHELAMAGGAIGELSDRELGALVDGLESLDALPSPELEGAEPVSVTAQEESR